MPVLLNRAARTLALGLSCLTISFATEIGLKDGEQFTYRVSWGIFGRAGDITVSANRVGIADQSELRVRTETSTRGFIRALYPFDGQADTFYNLTTGKFIRATAETKNRSKETNAKIVFDYESDRAEYTDYIRVDRSISLPIPENNPADFITTLIQSRSWDLKLGEKRAVSVLFDDEFYELVITAEAEEMVNTKWGKKSALVLVPRMEIEPKGMFKRGGEVRVWLSQDEAPLPLRFQVKMGVGTGLANLTDYQENAAPSPAANVNEPSS
jgi:hypothetical protein